MSNHRKIKRIVFKVPWFPILSFWWAIGSLRVGTLYIFHTCLQKKKHTPKPAAKSTQKFPCPKNPEIPPGSWAVSLGGQTCAKLELKIQPVFLLKPNRELIVEKSSCFNQTPSFHNLVSQQLFQNKRVIQTESQEKWESSHNIKSILGSCNSPTNCISLK